MSRAEVSVPWMRVWQVLRTGLYVWSLRLTAAQCFGFPSLSPSVTDHVRLFKRTGHLFFRNRQRPMFPDSVRIPIHDTRYTGSARAVSTLVRQTHVEVFRILIKTSDGTPWMGDQTIVWPLLTSWDTTGNHG